MARPGAAIQAFCEPVTTRSTPQASISNGTAPRPDTLSTRMSASGAVSRTTAASDAIGFMTEVDVSLWVSSTALYDGSRASSARTTSGSAAWPHSTSILVTSAPYVRAILANRSPNEPIDTPRTRSPGEMTLTTAASSPPVPAVVTIAMSLVVPK